MIKKIETSFNNIHKNTSPFAKMGALFLSFIVAIILSWISYNNYSIASYNRLNLLVPVLVISSILLSLISSPVRTSAEGNKKSVPELDEKTCSSVYDSLATRIGALSVMYTLLNLRSGGAPLIGSDTNARYLIYFALFSLTVSSFISSVQLWNVAEIRHHRLKKFAIQFNVIIFFAAVPILAAPELSGIFDSLNRAQFMFIVMNLIAWSVLLNVAAEKYKFRFRKKASLLKQVPHDSPIFQSPDGGVKEN